MRDLYSILGVPRSADQDAIRTRFKKLARKYHPDVSEDEKDHERFKAISAAYQILSDKSRRASYDEFGEISLKPGFDAEQARRWGGGGMPGGGGGMPGGFQGGVDLGDLLGSILGGRTGGPFPGGAGRGPARGPSGFPGGGGFPGAGGFPGGGGFSGGFPGGGFPGGGSPGRAPPSADIEQSIDIDVVESIHGASRVVSSGHERWRVKIPAGVEDGRLIRLRGKGRSQAGGAPGALLLRIRIRDQPGLRRDGADLHLDVPISLSEAMCGARVQVATPTGSVWVRVPPDTRGVRKLRLRGRGVPGDPSGDLYLHLQPTAPPATDPEAVKLAEQLARFYAGDLRAGVPDLTPPDGES